MSFPFKTPGTLELAARLKNNMNVIRERAWSNYVHAVSQVAQVPRSKLEAAVVKGGLQRHDRKFFLLQGDNYELVHRGEQLQKNYGYFLDLPTGKIYLMIPSTNWFNWLEEVKNAEAIPRIHNLITQKDAPLREATWDEMDAILNAFYGEDDEDHALPEFLNEETSISMRGDGKFRSATHAPHGYAIKQNAINSFAAQLKVEKKFRAANQSALGHPDQAKAKDLLKLSWFSHSKENFSWAPLADWFFQPNHAEDILKATPYLSKRNQVAADVYFIEAELKKETSDLALAKLKLLALQDILEREGERRNVFIDLFLAVVGVVCAPIALLFGLLWVIPACCLNSPYFGRAAFLLDTIQWFVDSLIAAVRCLLFPLEMIHAYNTSGSMNILKGECTRIIETLIDRVNELELANSEALGIAL